MKNTSLDSNRVETLIVETKLSEETTHWPDNVASLCGRREHILR